jgi:hypothetical protein
LTLWEAIPEFDLTKTFNEFKPTIFKLYPGSESECKWTIADIDKLVGEQLWMGILDVSDLRNYYQVFYAITQLLLTKHRIFGAEQSRAFIRGFLVDLRLSYLTMILMTFILSLKLTRLQNMFYMAPHKIAFYSQASHQPHPQLNWRHHTSKQKIY